MASRAIQNEAAVTSGSAWTVVVAGGVGSRFGSPKQFAQLGGRRVLDWSVSIAREMSDGVVLVLPKSAVEEGANFGADKVVGGGDTRSASVRNGLGAVPDEAAVIVVHDGARPLASPALYRSVVELVRAGADAAVPALNVPDTLKLVDGDEIRSTVSRENLVVVQTPQAFRADILRRAHEAGDEATDDSALVEALGACVRLVPGEVRNLKLTTPADLELAQLLVVAGS